jgi:hypothetical protein
MQIRNEDTPALAEATILAEAEAPVEGSIAKTQPIDISQFIQIGKQVPVHGLWFEVVKCDGPYVMLRAVGMTSRARRELLAR